MGLLDFEMKYSKSRRSFCQRDLQSDRSILNRTGGILQLTRDSKDIDFLLSLPVNFFLVTQLGHVDHQDDGIPW